MVPAAVHTDQNLEAATHVTEPMTKQQICFTNLWTESNIYKSAVFFT